MKIQIKRVFVTIILGVMLASLGSIKVDAKSTWKGQSQEEIDTAINKGFDYISEQVNEDGGVRWIDENSSTAATIRVVQALGAAGYTQDFFNSNTGNSPIDFLKTAGWDWVNQIESETPGFNVARAGQLLTGIAAANQNPHDFGVGNIDLIYEINMNYDRNTGIYGNADHDNVLDQVWAIIGLSANNASVPLEAANWLASVQADDGSWNDGFGSFLDTTPLAIMALIGSNYYEIESSTVQSALIFITENQQENGGWQTEWDTATNPNTTGVILQALSSLGQFPTDDNWQQLAGNPQSALISTQQENGVFGGEFGNTFSTADAIIGLTGQNIINLGFLQRASEAFDYLFNAQESDGGWRNVGQTIDVILVLTAAGWQPSTVRVDQASPLDYLSENIESYIESGPDSLGKAILGITAAGSNPGDFNGIDLGSILLKSYDKTISSFGDSGNTWHQALALLGLYSSEIEIPQGAVETLIGLQLEDGGWEYSTGFGSSPDSTSLAIQALIAAGYSEGDQVIIDGLDYLKNAQSDDGGWGDSSASSFALMGLNALSQTPDKWISYSEKNPISNLFSYQKANGAFLYSWDFPDDSIMSTASSLLALFGGDYLSQKNGNSGENFAAIIIDPGESAAQTACVSFKDESISGLDLLEMSGFEYQTDQDGFLNSIIDISNPEGETNYWSYWYWDGREWQFQNIGMSNTVILPGTVEAWHFTSWEQYPSLPPDYIPDIDDICGEEILADYSQQPNIDHNDLFPFTFQERADDELPSEELSQEPITQPAKNESTESSDGLDERIQTTPTSDKAREVKKENSDSPIAIVLIAVVGVITFFLLTILYVRRRK